MAKYSKRCKKIDILKNDRVSKTIVKKQQKQSKFWCICPSQIFGLQLMLAICVLVNIMNYQNIMGNLNSTIYLSEKKHLNNAATINNNLNNISYITEWNCSNLYVDLGFNIGENIRKVFEPEKYVSIQNRLFPTHFFITMKLYDDILGNLSTRRISSCAFGFEANPIDKINYKLKEIEKCYQSKGWKTKFNVQTVPFYMNNQSID
eukprot:383783_1